jgi:tRNA/rRNA methyltransferase
MTLPEPAPHGGRETVDPSVDPSARTRFVLVRPSHAGNVGAAARALRVMGFDRLVLVAPRDPRVLEDPQTQALASGALDVLARAQVVADLDAALGGAQVVVATAMTPRDFGPPVAPSRVLTQRLAAGRDSVAFVFGPERHGLANDEVYRCDTVLSIPADPAYGSLNLAQAVQIVAYDWRMALGGFDVVDRRAPSVRADAPSVSGLVAHWARVLGRLGYLDPRQPRKLLPRLHQLLLRARVQDEEVHILRGIARSIESALESAAEPAVRPQDESPAGPAPKARAAPAADRGSPATPGHRTAGPGDGGA